MNLALENRRVFLTGASRGIGLAIAHLFLENGAQVIGAAKDRARLTEAAAKLGQIGSAKPVSPGGARPEWRRVRERSNAGSRRAFRRRARSLGQQRRRDGRSSRHRARGSGHPRDLAADQRHRGAQLDARASCLRSCEDASRGSSMSRRARATSSRSPWETSPRTA